MTRRALEPVLVVAVALAVLAPGLSSYSLVDPWETHYGEVAREMLEHDDFVLTRWSGCYMCEPGEFEGFRSKPVLTFWLMAAGLRAAGLAEDGGYSGELASTSRTMLAIRMPFVLCAVLGLVLLWAMLARLLGRRTAWLGLLGVGAAPMVCLVARQGLPDVPLLACTVGAVALFALAVEDGERPIARLGRVDARHVVLGVVGLVVVAQAAYYAVYLRRTPLTGVGGSIPDPAIWLPLVMLILLAALARDGRYLLRLPLVLLGAVLAAVADEPMPRQRLGQSLWRHFVDDILAPWDRHAPDRYVVRGVAWLVLVAGGRDRPWQRAGEVAGRLYVLAPIETMRQVYLVGMYLLVGISVLAKGPPGLAVVGGTALLYVAVFRRWRGIVAGAFELKRGVALIAAVAVPWHVAMYCVVGPHFLDEYLGVHILDRASEGVDASAGGFGFYTAQLGPALWLWAGLVPGAVIAALLRTDRASREARVRTLVVLWAIAAMAVFCLVQTKFHHYILPAVPPLALLVALHLGDLAAGRDRLHPLLAAIGAALVLLVTRDLMHEPERWIEMFVFRYDRPWPSAPPYEIDPSDPILALGLAGAAAIALLATRAVRAAVVALHALVLGACLWLLHVYMPIAGTHWGMREAIRTYYEQRTIYGEQLVYFGLGQLYDAWHGRDTWTFDTRLPDGLQLGQPMVVRIRVHDAADDRIVEREARLVGRVAALGGHRVTVAFEPDERGKLAPWLAEAAGAARGRRAPVREVDADRLVAWMLYWRGELFWSGGEIWAWPPDMKTYFGNPNQIQFHRFFGDPSRAPPGRRYFLVTEADRIHKVRDHLPTERARATFEILDRTSNKFAIGAFYL